MTAPQFVLPADRPLTVADLDLTPDDGCRYELDDGVLVVSPAPMTIHQRVLHRLEVLLDAACPREFELLPGPGIAMSEIQYRSPDLVVVRADTVGVADKNLTRPPELVVEIASPSTAHYDRGRKKIVYAEYGIPGYWIVVPDPDQPLLTAYRLSRGRYTEVGRAAGGQRFAATSPFPVEIVPETLVTGRWRR
ncbi:MAG TPA: Uma2 family endonuclease [Streptosporangiaceae bacterium]|nr:Uma2 family endonuclease [Streptosporangiaceae bacterium]